MRTLFKLRLTFLVCCIPILFPIKLFSDTCKKLIITDFPQSDLPTKSDRELLKNKESYKFYYGAGVPIDYAKARKIAFIELENGDKLDFGGSGILTMIYANGYGVKQNVPFSISIACGNLNKNAWCGEDSIKRLNTLISTPTNKFDICDDSGTAMIGWCSWIQVEVNDYKRELETNAITKNWSRESKLEFIKLQKSKDEFFSARTENEVDISGSGRAAWVADEENKLKREFLDSISNLENGQFPNFTLNDFKNADTELNVVYSQIMETKDLEFGSVEPSGVKKVQKKWIPYRDSWVKFGTIHYPKVSTSSWKTWLTQKRIAQLKEFIQP